MKIHTAGVSKIIVPTYRILLDKIRHSVVPCGGPEALAKEVVTSYTPFLRENKGRTMMKNDPETYLTAVIKNLISHVVKSAALGFRGRRGFTLWCFHHGYYRET
jgi:hypothetical protein